jgi:hypothetical protein
VSRFRRAQIWTLTGIEIMQSVQTKRYGHRLRFVSERADSTEVLLAVDIPERPGTSALMHVVMRLCVLVSASISSSLRIFCAFERVFEV